MYDHDAVTAAFARVSEGYVAPAERTHEGADRLWCRLAAQGRVVARHHDGGRGSTQVWCTIIEHPALPAGEVYATFGMGQGPLGVYRCTPEDARLALGHHSAFNL